MKKESSLHNEIYEIFCKKCDESFAGQDALDNHVKQVHLGINKRLKKEQSSQCFEEIHPSKLNIHVKQEAHDNIYGTFCKKCDKSFASKDSMNTHVKAVHLGIKRLRKKVQCPKCLKEINSNNLNMHIKRVHDKIYDIFCKKCDKSFATKAYLYQHVKQVHLGIKKVWKKGQCPKCFKEMTVHNIKMHVKQVHDQIFDIFCKFCDKSFSSNEAVKEHLKQVHLGNKRLRKTVQCPTCLKEINSNSINMHIKRIHDKIYDIFCKECGKSYASTAELNKHVRRVHLGIIPLRKNDKKLEQKILCVKESGVDITFPSNKLANDVSTGTHYIYNAAVIASLEKKPDMKIEEHIQPE